MTRSPESAFWLALAYASDLRLARVKSMVTAWCLEGERPLATLFELPPVKIADWFGLSVEESGRVAATAGRVPEHEAWLTRLEGEGVELVTRVDPRYPRALIRSLPPAMQPLLLFCQGNVGMLNRPSVAVIGSRDAGVESVGFARELGMLLAEEGLVVVSGLGKGVGQAAFDSAFSTQGGGAIALLPMGISVFPGLRGAAGEATPTVRASKALILSPFHPEAEFTQAGASARNKLIVGLAEAMFVVVAGQTGIAWETATEALRLGKAVYVWDVEAEIEPAAAGNRALIEAGALPIGGVPDILDAIDAVVATVLNLTETAETPPTVPSSPMVEAEEDEAPFDPQAALDLLSKSGRVPEALARRLRGRQES